MTVTLGHGMILRVCNAVRHVEGLKFLSRTGLEVEAGPIYSKRMQIPVGGDTKQIITKSDMSRDATRE